MNRLTKLIAPALFATLALGAGVPASAAQWDNHNSIRQEIRQLDNQIDRAQSRHLISAREATRLSRNVDQLQKLQVRYARDGYTRAELRVLDQRLDTVKRQLAREIGDRDGRIDSHRIDSHDDHRGTNHR